MSTDARTLSKVIVFDGNSFWLWIRSGQTVEKIDLSAGNLPTAFKTARKLGHEVWHWCRLDMQAQDIPVSIDCG